MFDPPIPMPTGTNVLGPWLGLIGAGLTYFPLVPGDLATRTYSCFLYWGFLCPGTAVLLGWLFLDQTLSALQIISVLLVIREYLAGPTFQPRTPRGAYSLPEVALTRMA